MKNRKFWITSAVLAVVIIIVVLVIKYGGKKVKFKENDVKYTWAIGSNGTEFANMEFDQPLRYVVTPFRYNELTLYPGSVLSLTMIPIKAVGMETEDGKVRRMKVSSGTYMPKDYLII